MRKSLPILIALLFFAPKIMAECLPGAGTLDSARLNQYTFVALVKITANEGYSDDYHPDDDHPGELHFTIIELFKGDRRTTAVGLPYFSRMSRGMAPGEQWLLVVGKDKKGVIRLAHCDPDVRYKTVAGERDWYYRRGFDELDFLRTYYHHTIPARNDGPFTERYPDGKKELMVTYKRGGREGLQEIYYPDGRIMCRQTFIRDSLDGRSVWYSRSGQVVEEEHFWRGRNINISRIFYDTAQSYRWDDSLPDAFVTRRDHLEIERLYNADGIQLRQSEYTPEGRLRIEEYTIRSATSPPTFSIILTACSAPSGTTRATIILVSTRSMMSRACPQKTGTMMPGAMRSGSDLHSGKQANA